MSSTALLLVALVLIVGALGGIVYTLARIPVAIRPEMGVRGLKRQAALDDSAAFRLFEPVVRYVAARLSTLPLDDLRHTTRQRLLEGGEWLGLDVDEFLALSLVWFVGATIAALALTYFMPGTIEPIYLAVLVVLGLMVPNFQVQGEIGRRFKQVNRGLPFAIDLASLAMSAGSDFPGALRQVTDKSADKTDALYEELSRILDEINLGRTRKQALVAFAERCPTESVKDFVYAVVQSEEKGNPLSEVLQIQSTMLRMRRSVSAEEAAARAGVLMLGPLMLIFACIMLIILGPFIVNSLNGKGI